MKEKVSCWEYKNCQSKESCPAYPMYGRLCFSVKGTLCDGRIQGDYKEKISRCREKCAFYQETVMNK